MIDALQDNLKLTERLVRPSRQTLYHYGNTSSSSVWYELAWMETQRGMVQYGDRIWQISFGESTHPLQVSCSHPANAPSNCV